MPEHHLAWQQWSAEEWNRNLLLFCFVQEAQAPPWQGIRASEDDLPVLTGDTDTPAVDQAMALRQALGHQAALQPGSFTPAALMASQVEAYRPSARSLPPFFAFLWFTCLLAHGFPDPQLEGRFHSRFEQIFGLNQARHLQALPTGWEKLVRWLAIDGIFNGVPHRQLQLRPIPGNARRIGHSWTLSFPRLADRQLLLEQLSETLQRGYQLDPWAPAFIARLQNVRGFSHDFRAELQVHADALRGAPDQDSWFTAFLLAEIEQLLRASERADITATDTSFGPLLLKDLRGELGVLLLADGLPADEIQPFQRVPGADWGVEHADLLLPADSDDPIYAAFDAGSLAIDLHDSPIRRLQPLLQRGLLLFRLDPALNQLRQVIGDPAGALSHALVSDAHATTFQNRFGGDPVPFAEEGWQCIRRFTATPEQLRRFPIPLNCRSRTDRPQLFPVAGQRLQHGFLATGAGLPDVCVRGPQQPRALLLLSPENRSIDYEPALTATDESGQAEPDPSRWSPRTRGRSIRAFETGDARLVAFFDHDQPTLEYRLRLDRVPPRPVVQRGDPLHRREDWGLTLGPTWLDQELPSDEQQAPSAAALREARFRLNDGQNHCNTSMEEQMLEALCATFQRMPQIKDRDFKDLFMRLGSMSTERRHFVGDVLRAWIEGGWLDQGLALRRGLWRLQPVQPRLVILPGSSLQLVGLLPAIGLTRVVAHALDLGLGVTAVPPACAQLPRGWRFEGENWPALAVCTGLPLVDRQAWVPDPVPISWQVEPQECDRTDWGAVAGHSEISSRITGHRGGQHRHPGERLSDGMVAPSHTAIQMEQGTNGRCRWHSEEHGGRFSSCHRNRVVLHALNEITNGLWPFGTNSKRWAIHRIYDADAYLPLPLGRFAALTGAGMPGPDLPHDLTDHTYRYFFDEATFTSLRTDQRLPLTKPKFPSKPKPPA